MLLDIDWDVRYEADRVLKEQKDSDEPQSRETLDTDLYMRLLPHYDPSAREQAAFGLEICERLPPGAAEALVQLLHDENLSARAQAAFALAKHNNLPELEAESLILLLQHQDSIIRHPAVRS